MKRSLVMALGAVLLVAFALMIHSCVSGQSGGVPIVNRVRNELSAGSRAQAGMDAESLAWLIRNVRARIDQLEREGQKAEAERLRAKLPLLEATYERAVSRSSAQ